MAYRFNAITGQFDLVGVTVLPPGTGDVMGPVSSTPGNIAIFDDATGKILADSGISIDSLGNYSQIFNATSDWTGPASDSYTLTVTKAVHLKDNPIVTLYELNGTDYIQVETGVRIDTSENILITVNSTPDLRFAGKLVIS